MARPQCVVIGGPNGAGKTTLAPVLLRDIVGIDAFVNADLIAEELAPGHPGSVALEAGRVMVRQIRELIEARAHFAIESTLSGRSAARLVNQLMRIGYDVHVLYLWLPSPELSVARVRHRVRGGGHDVPEAVIRRRFRIGLVNFERVYRRSTIWRLYDNSGIGERPLIGEGMRDNVVQIMNEEKWRAVHRMIREAA